MPEHHDETISNEGAIPTETTINRGWLLKMAIFIIVLSGLGVWGLIDALIVYPNRGRAHAAFAEMQYLQRAEELRRISTAPVDEPQEELRALRAQREQFTNPATPDQELRKLRLEWLTALSRVGELDPERTDIQAPRTRLRALESELQQRNPPKPLAAYDIPFQWLLVVVGFGASVYLLIHIARVSGRKYTYNPETMTLTLPSGRALAPADLQEIDKRKWDKFIVTLRPREGAPARLDLLHHKHLEDWILEMEKHVEGYEPPPAEQEQETADEPERAAG